MDDINNLSPQERKYVEVYDQVSHEILQNKDPEAIVRELVAEGYNEKEAALWVVAVGSRLRDRTARRSIYAMLTGVCLVIIALVLRIEDYGSSLAFGATFTPLFLLVIGVVFFFWGLTSWAQSSRRFPPRA
jgi:hypothetical protein